MCDDTTGWEETTLGKVCTIQIGGTPSRSMSEYWARDGEDGHPWVSISDLHGKTIERTQERITDAGARRSNVKPIPKGALLMSFKLTIGRVAFAGTDLFTNEAIAALVNPTVDPEFLYYGLQQWDLLADVDQAIKGATLNKDKLKRIRISYPQREEVRQAITKVLTKIDDAIACTEALISKYRRIRTGLIQDLLTKGMDDHGRIRSEATHAFKDSPIGRIPVEWEVYALDELFDYITYGFTNPMPEASEGPYMVTAANIDNGRINYADCRKTTAHAYHHLLTRKSRPSKGDLLLTKDGTLGRLAIVDKEPLCVNQSVAVMRPNKMVDVHLLKQMLEAPIYQDRMLEDAGGSTIKHLYISKVGKMPVAIPECCNEREALNRILNVHAAQLENLVQESQKLRHLKTGLMQDLMTGRVPVDVLLRMPSESQEAIAV